MTNNSEVNRIIERGFENIAYDLDSFASRNSLDSVAMKPLIQHWDFTDYYLDWMSEGWE